MPDFTPIFEVAFAVDPADEPVGAEWIDLSSRLRGTATWSLGAGRLSGGAHGTCSVTLDNHDRLLDPTNSSATYNLVPLRHARLRVTVGATTYDLFRGLVDAWPPTWTGFDEWVTVNLVDGFAWLALQDADIDLPEQLSSDRVTDLLDLAAWPAGLRDIETGITVLEPWEQNSGNLLRSLQDAADAEGGDLFVAPDGKINFTSKHDRLGVSSIITLGEGGTPFSAATPAWDTSWLTNIARLELADGRVYETVDDTSVTAYGPRVMPTRDLALSPAEAEGKGQWEVVRFAEPHLWLDGVLFESPETDVLADVLPLRVGNVVTVAFDPQNGASVSEDMGIERHGGSMSNVAMTLTLDLAPQAGYEGPWFTLDHDTYGLPNDTNKLAP